MAGRQDMEIRGLSRKNGAPKGPIEQERLVATGQRHGMNVAHGYGKGIRQGGLVAGTVPPAN